MTQDLLVFFIIASTVGYIGLSFVRNLRTKKVTGGCGGCTGCEMSKKNVGCK